MATSFPISTPTEFTIDTSSEPINFNSSSLITNNNKIVNFITEQPSDLLVRNTSGTSNTLQRLGIGTDGQYLTASGTAVAEVSNLTTVAVGAGVYGGKYFFVSSPSTHYYVWFNQDGLNTDPGLARPIPSDLVVDGVIRTPVVVNVTTGNSAATAAFFILSALNALSDFTVAPVVYPTIAITNTVAGVADDISSATLNPVAGFVVSTPTQGVSTVPTWTTFVDPVDDSIWETATVSGNDIVRYRQSLSINDHDLVVPVGNTEWSSGTETKMYYDVFNSAFRMGSVTGTEWDNANRNTNSAAFGLDTTASGVQSFAIGTETVASGEQAFAIGRGTISAAEDSFTYGHTETSGIITTILAGQGNLAGGNTDSSGIIRTTAAAEGSIAIGFSNSNGLIEASGNGVLAFGRASGFNVTATGEILSSGDGSIALGRALSGANTTKGTISSSGDGSLAVGSSVSSINIVSTMSASQTGAMVFGSCNRSTMTSSGEGALCSGSANYFDTSGSTFLSGGLGSHIFGHGSDGTLSSNGNGSCVIGSSIRGSTISSDSNGSIAWGRADFTSTSSNITITSAEGSMAGGYTIDTGLINISGAGSNVFGCSIDSSNILCRSNGCFTFGFSDNTSNILGGTTTGVAGIGRGSFCGGFADNISFIRALNNGSMAMGNSDDAGVLESANDGSITLGTASTGTIRSNGTGSIAMGNSTLLSSSLILSSGDGSISGGFSSGGIIRATNNGSICLGYNSNSLSVLESSGLGSFATGAIITGDALTTLRSTNSGSFTCGRVSGNSSILESTGLGSFTTGYIFGNGSTITSSSDGSFVGGHILNTPGNPCTISSTGQGSFALGFATETSTITSSGAGSVAFGVSSTNNEITSSNFGSFAGGHATAGNVGGSYIRSGGRGSFAYGHVTDNNSRINGGAASLTTSFAFGIVENGGFISSNGNGSFASGSVDDSNLLSTNVGSTAFGRAVDATTGIQSTGIGSFVTGMAQFENSEITASNRGAFAGGYTSGFVPVGTTNAHIRSTAFGSFSYGYCRGQSGGGIDSHIIASSEGSFASGHTESGGHIDASGRGSRAHGFVNASSETISASADGSFAFGRDVQTAQASSMIIGQYGTALAASLPSTPLIISGVGSLQIGGGSSAAVRDISVMIGTITPGAPSIGGGVADHWYTTGADFAELMEWNSIIPIPTGDDIFGNFVRISLTNGMMEIATQYDDVEGVSTDKNLGNVAHLGNLQERHWKGAMLRDKNGRAQKRIDYVQDIYDIINKHQVVLTDDLYEIIENLVEIKSDIIAIGGILSDDGSFNITNFHNAINGATRLSQIFKYDEPKDSGPGTGILIDYQIVMRGSNPNDGSAGYLQGNQLREILLKYNTNIKSEINSLAVTSTDGSFNITNFRTEITNCEGREVTIQSPKWDRTLTYVGRMNRNEWGAMSFLGQVYVKQDGTITNPGVRCTCNKDGVATLLSRGRNGWRVLEVIDSTVVRILMK